MSAKSPTPLLIQGCSNFAPLWGRPPVCRFTEPLAPWTPINSKASPTVIQRGTATAVLGRITAAVSLILVAPELWAAQSEATGIVPSSSSVLVTIFRMLGALAIVFAVFFCGVWLFRNWQGLLRQRGVAPKLRVMEFKSLGTRQALYVVAYERQRFLISSSSAGVALVTSLPEADDETVSAVTHAPTFADALLKVLNKK
jgi:flagellar biogenesis protein FliO